MTTTYERKYFFDSVRAMLFYGNLTQSQVDGMNYLLDTWEKSFPAGDERWLAYALATTYHETAMEMRPIEEYGKGQGYPYGEPTGPYGKCYYGRGHVQLTWEENYVKASNELLGYDVKADLHKFPEDALEDGISALILYDGMSDGWFTGKKLGDYFYDQWENPVDARAIVNGTDKADLIASYYWKFKEALLPVPETPPAQPVGPQMQKPIIIIDIPG
jgi:hypothetical protein